MLDESSDQAPRERDDSPGTNQRKDGRSELQGRTSSTQEELHCKGADAENGKPAPQPERAFSVGERWLIGCNIALVIATGILAWVTHVVAVETRKLATDTHALVEGEHRNTVLSHRAWVAVIPAIASDLVWTDDDVRMKVAVAMTNFSNFPAMKVAVRPEMTLAKRCVPYTASDISTVLNEKRNMPEAELSGTYIFPGKENAITQ